MDIKTIKHVAALARIEITQKEEEKIKDELSSILGYIEHLNKVNTENIEPLYQVTGLVNSMREDKSGHFKMDEVLNQKLIGQTPHKKDRFIKVKSILNKGD